MTTLLLRLAGPMQSWGIQSRFRDRDTGLEPSKSGVIGLLCAALGRPRDASVADLVALRMGVRVDRPGTMRVDYQTAGGNYPRYNARGALVGRVREAVISPRYYLADASFLVGLEGDADILRRVDAALAAPRWQICLGRRAFPPGEPVRLPDSAPLGPGMQDGPLGEALRAIPLPVVTRGEGEHRVRVVMDSADGESNDLRTDVPLSFADRRFGTRRVITDWMEMSR